jgi:hypothetical protein
MGAAAARWELLRMNRLFSEALERAFKRGREFRASASACVPERRVSMPTAVALTDQQLADLRAIAATIPRHLRNDYLQILGRQLSNVEIGDGIVHSAALAARSAVLNGGRHRDQA